MTIYFSAERWVQAFAFYLRTLVFVQEQAIDPQLEFDHLDTDDRRYFLLMIDEQPVATLRYQFKSETVIQPDRLCVLKQYRNRSLGTELMTRLEEQARKDGCQLAVLSAEVTAVTFYHQLGYHSFGENYLEDGLLCVQMQKKL